MATNGVDYPSVIDRISDIETFNVGFAGTTWVDNVSEVYTPFSMNRLVDAICDEDFSLIEAQISKCNSTYQKRFETLKSIDFGEVDCITMFFGTNDWNNGAILKSENDSNTINKQRTNVEDAIKYSVSRLQDKFPDIKIIVIAPYWLTFNKTDTDENPNKNGDFLEEYCDCIIKTASSLAVDDTINLYETLNMINFENYKNYVYDGVHPTNKLQGILADILIRAIHNLKN